jgi:hypothetical protein
MFNPVWTCKTCTGDAWERVLKLTDSFMQKEAYLWKYNRELLERAEAAEEELKQMKNKKEFLLTDTTDNILPFAKPALITGGPTGSDGWLKTLDKGSLFLARRKGDKALNFDKYFLVRHFQTMSELYFVTPEGKQITLWVNTLEFSRSVDLGILLEVLEFEREESKDDE